MFRKWAEVFALPLSLRSTPSASGRIINQSPTVLNRGLGTIHHCTI